MEALRFEHISKSFGSVKANNDVSFSLEQGNIYAILGENGSGKTSLMNVVAGIYQQDEGKIYINEEEAIIRSPRDAFVYRVGMVHQHFKLVDKFTSAENVVLGLTKADYEVYHQEQHEKLEEKISKYGTKNSLKEQIKICKKRMKEHPENEELAPLLHDLEKKLGDIKRYTRYDKRSKHFNLEGASERITNIAHKYGMQVDPSKRVHDMSVSEKQQLEILKVLYRGVDILILDEPTAVLTPQEIDNLFNSLRNMKKLGKTIIIITHKLNEVMEISDKVVVLRKGEYIGTVTTSKATQKGLTEMMVGKKMDLNIVRTQCKNPIDRLFVKNLTVKDIDGRNVLDNVTFTARGGEILGIAGISGSGQKELLEAIAGIHELENGEIIFINPKKDQPVSLIHKDLKTVKELAAKGTFHYEDGKPVDISTKNNKEIKNLINSQQIIFNEDEVVNLKDKNPYEIRQLGIRMSFVPEDRLGMGLVGNMDLTDNMMLRSYRKGGPVFLDRKNPSDLANNIVDELEVSTPNIKTPVRRLSGGNIQKVLVGREISFAPKVLMTAYPVRGLDINSSYLIYNLLDQEKQRGTSVIYVGEDLDVLMELCDRILVLSHGKVAGIVDPTNVTKDKIGLLMTMGGK